MGFDYEIQYRSGKENVAADALSRFQGSELLSMALSMVGSDVESKIKTSYQLDPDMMDKLSKLQQGMVITHYTQTGGLLKRKKKIVVGPDPQLRTSIIAWHHGSTEARHIGRDATTMRVKRLFYWRSMVKHIKQYIRICNVCQATKYEPLAYPGLV